VRRLSPVGLRHAGGCQALAGGGHQLREVQARSLRPLSVTGCGLAHSCCQGCAPVQFRPSNSRDGYADQDDPDLHEEPRSGVGFHGPNLVHLGPRALVDRNRRSIDGVDEARPPAWMRARPWLGAIPQCSRLASRSLFAQKAPRVCRILDLPAVTIWPHKEPGPATGAAGFVPGLPVGGTQSWNLDRSLGLGCREGSPNAQRTERGHDGEDATSQLNDLCAPRFDT
jgi:hypothetical protein